MTADETNHGAAQPSGDVQMLPSEVPVGWFVFDNLSGVWVEVTSKPVTEAGVTAIWVIDGFDVPLLFDSETSITACRGVGDDDLRAW